MPVIIVTGFADLPKLDEIRAMGVDPVRVKPFRARELEAVVRPALAGRE